MQIDGVGFNVEYWSPLLNRPPEEFIEAGIREGVWADEPEEVRRLKLAVAYQILNNGSLQFTSRAKKL